MNVEAYANSWIKSWNSHNLDEILKHYTEDVEISTPMIKMALGIDSGTLKGKEAVADYWRKALAKLPELHFELIQVTQGVNSIALYYKSVMAKMAIEVMFLNEEGKVYRMIAHYTN